MLQRRLRQRSVQQGRRPQRDDHTSLHLTGEAALERITLQTWEDLHDWRRDNEYITGGYRSESGSYTQSFASWRYLHNESVNIYTHLFGAASLAIVCYVFHGTLRSKYETVTTADALVFGAFFLSAIVCLSASTAFHTLLNHSPKVAQSWLFLDFMGILIMIIGSFYPGIYYGFRCQPTLTYFYSGMITVIGTGCIVACALPQFSQPKYRSFRALLFASMGLSGLMPLTHGILLHGPAETLWQMGSVWYVVEAVIYLLGTVVYACRFPERLNPGAYDIWGHSHQVLHVAVLLGAASHLRGILHGFEYNHNPATRPC